MSRNHINEGIIRYKKVQTNKKNEYSLRKLYSQYSWKSILKVSLIEVQYALKYWLSGWNGGTLILGKGYYQEN